MNSPKKANCKQRCTLGSHPSALPCGASAEAPPSPARGCCRLAAPGLLAPRGFHAWGAREAPSSNPCGPSSDNSCRAAGWGLKEEHSPSEPTRNARLFPRLLRHGWLPTGRKSPGADKYCRWNELIDIADRFWK